MKENQDCIIMVSVFLTETSFLAISFIISGWIYTTASSEENYFNTNGQHFIMSFLPSSETFSSDFRVDLHAKVIGEETVTVQIRSPLWSHASAVETSVQLPPNTDAEIRFPKEIVVSENLKGTSSILFTSTADISLTGYQVEVGYAGAYVILPSSILGTEYIVLTLGYGRSMVNIIATSEEETVVSFTLPKTLSSSIQFDSRSFSAGETIIISLNQYENYLIASDEDLSSSVVVGTKPFAVICAEKNRNGDNEIYFIAEQALPLHLWGNEFVLANNSHSTNSTFKIVVAKDTYLTFGTDDPVFVQQGNPHVIVLQASSVHLTADAPVMVGKLGQSFDLDRAFVIISPQTNFAKEFTFTVIPDIGACVFNWTVSIITQSHDVILGPGLQAPVWQDVPHSNWKVSSVTQQTTSLSINTISSNKSLIGILLNGFSEGCSSEFSLNAVAVTPVQKWEREGDIYSTGFRSYLEDQLPYNNPFQAMTARSKSECFKICSGKNICSYVAIETVGNDSRKNCMFYTSYLPCFASRINEGAVIYQRYNIQTK